MNSMPEHPGLDTAGRIDCTGDVVAGDNILFCEPVWNASYNPRRRSAPVPAGFRTITAEVVRESYGPYKQQHTFTLRVIGSSGHDAIEPGTVIWRKGRNIYRNGCWRLPWSDESAREEARHEKHSRGNAVRNARAARRKREAQNGQPYA